MENVNEGWTSLHKAAEGGHHDIIYEILVCEGLDINAKDEKDRTPLHIASRGKNERSIDIILKSGGNINAMDCKGYTPLHFATEYDSEVVIKFLVKHGAHCNVKNSMGDTPLHIAARDGQDNNIEILVQNGGDINAKNGKEQTPLHFAAQWGHDRTVQIVVESGADVNASNEEGQTPLLCAARWGRDRSFEILLESGADVKAKDNLERTCMHLAAMNGQERIIEILMKRGFVVEIKDIKGSTPLHLAVENEQDKTIHLLLQSGAHCNARNNIDETPVHIAGRKAKSVEILIKSGGDVNAKNNQGKTPLHKAAILNKYSGNVEKLVNGGAVVNIKDDEGSTPLHIAVKGGNEIVAAILVQAGCDMFSTDKRGKRALDYAETDLKEYLMNLPAQMEAFKAQFPGIANATEFSVLLYKGTYNSYNNRLYFAGACNVGKSTLASNFIGEDISLYWNSTDGLKIYFGRNGIDLKSKEMVPIVKGIQDRNVLVNILRGNPTLDREPSTATDEIPSTQLDHPPNDALDKLTSTVKSKGVITMITRFVQKLFRRRRKKTTASANQELNYFQAQVISNSPKQGHLMQNSSNLLERVDKRETESEYEKLMTSKPVHTDIYIGLREEVKSGRYKVHIAPCDLVDFGGQRSYDLTHQLFIQQKGAFVLLLDGRKHLDHALLEYQQNMTTRDILLHWVNSILTYCSTDDDDIYPLILFAATHSDELSKAKQKCMFKEFTEQLKDMFSKHEHRERIKVDQLFFINATDEDDLGVQALKQYLVSVAFQQKSWGEKMPMAWVPLELQISELRSEKMFIIPFDKLNELNRNNEDLSFTDKQFKHFLRCQHSLGRLMYFDLDRLNEFIIIEPTAMVDILRSFITDEIFWPADPYLNETLRTARENGIIKKDDLIKLWSQDAFEIYFSSEKSKVFIIQLLIHLDILVEPKRYHKTEEETLSEAFIVPCMIRQTLPSVLAPWKLDGDKTIFLSYKLLKSSITNALAYKLIGAVLNIWPLKKHDGRSCLFDKGAILEIDRNNDLYLSFRNNRFIVAFSNIKFNTYISPDVASIIQECLTLTLRKVLEFYLSSFGKSATITDVDGLFEEEVGAKCDEDLCFVSLSDVTNKSHWICQNQREHNAQFPLYWKFDQNQEMCVYNCKGLGPQALNDVPEDRHLIRLAKLIGREFNQFIIYLGLKKAEWDDIEDNKNYNDRLIQKFIGLLEWKNHSIARDIAPTFKSLSKALSDIEYSDHFLCQIFREQFTQVFAMDNPRLQEPPDDGVLQELSRNIGPRTLHLGVELGLDMTSIEETQFKYSKDVFAQTYDILKKWKTTCSVKPTVRSLMLALQYVDPRGFRFLKEQYETTKKHQDESQAENTALSKD